MPESNQPEEKVVSATAQSTPTSPTFTPQAQRIIINLAATVVFFSFFLPWIIFLGSNMSGLDIQKNFSSYRLVWLVPVLAVITLLLNMSGTNTNLVRRIAGLCPLGILAYALNQMGTDLFKIVGAGGWLAIIGGVVLICIPNIRKSANLS
jgi:hypothetical protein